MYFKNFRFPLVSSRETSMRLVELLSVPVGLHPFAPEPTVRSRDPFKTSTVLSVRSQQATSEPRTSVAPWGLVVRKESRL